MLFLQSNGVADLSRRRTSAWRQDPASSSAGPTTSRARLQRGRQFGRRVAALMMKEQEDGEGGIDVGVMPGQPGMESLMATELRRWWKLVLGLDDSVLEIMGVERCWS